MEFSGIIGASEKIRIPGTQAYKSTMCSDYCCRAPFYFTSKAKACVKSCSYTSKYTRYNIVDFLDRVVALLIF